MDGRCNEKLEERKHKHAFVQERETDEKAESHGDAYVLFLSVSFSV